MQAKVIGNEAGTKWVEDKQRSFDHLFHEEAAASDRRLIGYQRNSVVRVVDKQPMRGLVGHALCAAGDTIFLLADIGRAYRTCALLSLQAPLLFVAGTRWSEENRGNDEFFPDPIQKSDALALNSFRRQRLYRAIKAEVDEWDYSAPWARQVDSAWVDGRIVAAEAILDAVAKGIDLTKLGPKTPDGIALQKVLAAAIKEARSGVPPQDAEGAMRIALLRDNVNLIRVLKSLAQYFSTVGSEVLRYFFAQQWVQEQYIAAPNRVFLKISPISEYEFFDSQYYTNGKDGLSGLYYPHYRVGSKRVLPYNILSFEWRGEDLLEMQMKVPFLGRYIPQDIRVHACEHTASGLGAWNRLLVADLLSFLAFTTAFSLEEVRRMVEPLEPVLSGVTASIQAVRHEWVENPEEFATWTRVMANQPDDRPFFIAVMNCPVEGLGEAASAFYLRVQAAVSELVG